MACIRLRDSLGRSPGASLLLAMAGALPMGIASSQVQADAPAPMHVTPAGIQLAPGERLAHQVITGALGPWAKVQVVLTQAEDAEDAPFTGYVVLASGQVLPLPAPAEPAEFFMMRVNAVALRSVDADANKELLVLYSAVQIGPQNPPYHGVQAYKWNGERFIHLPGVESHLDGAKSVAEIDSRLAHIAPPKPATNQVTK